MASEQQFVDAKRKLYPMLGRVHLRLRLLDAEPHLPPRVKSLVHEASEDLDAWLRESGELLGVKRPALNPQ